MPSKTEMIQDILTCLEYEARDSGENLGSLSDILFEKPYCIVVHIWEEVYNGDMGIEDFLDIYT